MNLIFSEENRINADLIEYIVWQNNRLYNGVRVNQLTNLHLAMDDANDKKYPLSPTVSANDTNHGGHDIYYCHGDNSHRRVEFAVLLYATDGDWQRH